MNLLARIVETIGSRKAENIASGALGHLLDSYDEVRLAFLEMIEVHSGVTVNRELRFVTQHHAVEQGGFTDVSGVGAAGVEELIIEAKIGAGLHEGQVRRYLDRLAGAAPVLVVLTPGGRLSAVFADALRQSAAEAVGRLRAVEGTTTLVGLSWEDLIGRLEALALPDASAAAEVAQVVGLYEHLEQRTFIPFSGAELATGNGRLWRSIERALWETLTQDRLATSPHITFTGNSQVADSSFGQWALINGVKAWFGVWPQYWAELGETPFWLYLVGLEPVACAHAQEALRELDPEGRPSVWKPGEGWLAVAIYPRLAADVKEVAAEMADRVLEAAQCLVDAGIRGTATAAPAGEVSTDDDAQLPRGPLR